MGNLKEQNDKKIWEEMTADCSKCSGLCCVSLFFSKMDGFPKDKKAGVPCLNLLPDYRCKIHSELCRQNMRGCIGYDCFGAGQYVTQVIYQGKTWQDLQQQGLSKQEVSKQQEEIFEVFLCVFQLYQIRYYLTDAMQVRVANSVIGQLQSLINENRALCQLSPQEILLLDIEEYQDRANEVLKQVCKLLSQNVPCKAGKLPNTYFGGDFKGKNMDGVDFSTQLLIAANFTNCSFAGANFLGADTRDTIFDNADLREAVFLTQRQVNAAKGNSNTRLPVHLTPPTTWK